MGQSLRRKDDAIPQLLPTQKGLDGGANVSGTARREQLVQLRSWGNREVCALCALRKLIFLLAKLKLASDLLQRECD